MRVWALLSWYDEDPVWLEKAIRSLTKGDIDGVIACDGAYELFPDGRPQSPPDQAETIQRICDELGMGCHIHTPSVLWSGEVEKRTHMFRMLDEVATPNVDWCVIWDADQILHKADNLKARLEQTDRDAADMAVIETPDPAVRGKPCHPGTTIPVPNTFDVRGTYRAIPGIEVIENHYTYITPDGRCLWGNVATHELVQALDLRETYVCLHKTYLRPQLRKGRNVRYYLDRDKSMIEVKWCADCGGPATRTARVNWERHPNGVHLIAEQLPVCERHFQFRLAQEAHTLRKLGVDPNQGVVHAGKVTRSTSPHADKVGAT
jgi:hypothetical protein